MIYYVDITDLSDEHKELIRIWRNRPDICCSMLNQHPISKEEHLKWLDSLLLPNATQKLRMVFEGDTPFAVLTLKGMDPHAQISDWGFYIGDPTFRSRGLSKRLLYDLLEWAFEEEGIFRLYTSVLASNTIAMVLYQRSGFRLEGCFKQHVLISPDERVDLNWLAMHDSEWILNKKEISSWKNIGD